LYITLDQVQSLKGKLSFGEPLEIGVIVPLARVCSGEILQMKVRFTSRAMASVTSIFAICFVAGSASITLEGCSSSTTERYVSPKVQGESEKINLEAVQKAFWESKGNDLNSWMAAFEKRVNEIYEGTQVVSIDATRKDNKLVVTGYIDTQKKEGFVPGDEKLFTIEQTGDAANNQMPYQMTGQTGQVYYQGSHSILDNPFFQALLIGHLFNSWGGHYYTPPGQVVVLHDYRNSYRTSPSWGQQQSYNNAFSSRYKTNASGGLQSKTGFGSSSFSSGSSSTNRSWGGSSTGSSSAGEPSSSSWGGRRSSGFGSVGSGSFSRGLSRGWGGRRR
jgi:hypothetical protein